jgi:Rha family phage regulatory protein
MQQLIEVREQNGQFVVSSKEIAIKFGKRHSDVIRSIKNIIKELPNDFTERNFASVDITSEKNLKGNAINIEYFLTKDAFAFTTMGFTGKKAVNWKIKFISAFNEMENVIKNKIPELMERIALLELNQKKTTKYLNAQQGTLMTPVWQENLFGEMEVRRFERKILEKVDKIDALEAMQLHAQKTMNGINKKIEKITTELNIENRTRQNKAVRQLKPVP